MNDTSDDTTARRPDPEAEPTEGRYGLIEMANGDVVIYDQERPTAWVQSDSAVGFDD